MSLRHPRPKRAVTEQIKSKFMVFLTSARIVAHEQKVTKSTRPVRNTPRLDIPPLDWPTCICLARIGRAIRAGGDCQLLI